MNSSIISFPKLRARLGRHTPVIAVVSAFVANLIAPCDASAQSLIVRSGDPRIEATNTVVRAFNNPMEMGFNVHWYNFQGDQQIGGLKVGLWDIVAKRVRPEIVNYFATQYLNATFRYPGGNQNEFIWKNTIGPMAQRPLHATPTGATPKGQMQVEFGFDEFMGFVEITRGKAIIGVNMVGMTAQDAADWVSYANATTGYWAELRAANGHAAPYNIRVWELGNELDHPVNSPFYNDPDAYVASCRQYIAAMRAVDPTIQFQALARSAPWGNSDGWRTWHQTVLQGLGTDIAALVFHPYYDGISIKTMRSYISVIAADAAALVPVNTPKIYNTEHAMWKDDNDDNWETSSITGAKASGDFLIMAANHAAVSGNCWHVLGGDGGWWRPFEYDAVSNLYYAPRPSTNAMQVLSRHLRGKETLATTVYTPNAAGYWGGYDVRAAVLRDATGQLAVAAVNRGAGVNCVMALPGLSGTVAGRYEIVQGTSGVETVNTTFTIASDGTFNAYLYPGLSVLQLDANLPPQVVLTSPAADSSYVVGETVPLAATASDPDGVALVEFYHGGSNFIAEDMAAPFEVVWTPAGPGAYSLTAVAHDLGDPFASAISTAIPVTVERNLVPVITTTALPDPVRNASYSRTLDATPGNGALTFSVRAGALPEGLALSSSGTVSGVPTKLGKSHFIVGVTDSDRVTGHRDESLQVLSLHVRQFQWGDPPSPEGVEGTVLRVSAGAPFSHVDNDGEIWTSDSDFLGGHTVHRPFEIAGTDNDQLYQSERYGLTGFSAPVENGRYRLTLHFAENDRRYDQPGQRVFSIAVEGAAPAELQMLDIAAAVGFRTAVVKTVVVDVADGRLDLAFTASAGPTLINALSLVPVPNSIPEIATTVLPGAGVDMPYAVTLAATGGDGILIWSLDSGVLPVGLTLTSDGVLAGTPSIAGTFPFTLRLADSDHRTGEGDEDVRALILVVRPHTLRIEAGSNAGFIDTHNQFWSPDSGFTGGVIVDRGNIPIGNSDDDRIYQTERYGVTGFGAEVVDGDYMLNLHFAETYTVNAVAGARVFSVQVEGASPERLQNIDLFATVGLNAAHVISVPVTISDHRLDLTFIAQSLSPLISGLELVQFVDAVPAISTTALPGAIATLPYSQRVQAVGGNGAPLWTLESGELPAGLSLSANGTITGIPTLPGVYTFTLRVADSDAVIGSADEATAEFTLTVGSAPQSVTFMSVPGQNGRVSESAAGSGVGGTAVVSNNNNAGDLRVGDTSDKRQFKTILSFDTSGLPDNAVIVSARLRVVRGVQSYTLTAFGPMYADVRTGAFSDAAALEGSDFEAPATAGKIATMSYPATNNTASLGELDGAGLAAINRSGTTQFRLHYLVATNNDGLNNYLGFWNGGAVTAANRPSLEVTYYVP